MNASLSAARAAGVALGLLSLVALSGCGRGDTRVNSDPGPGKPSRADAGDRTMRPDPNNASPSTTATSAPAGTDSTGRPEKSSGGTVGGGAGSETSGTATPRESAPAR